MRRVLPLLMLGLLVGGCTFDVQPCNSDDDCPSGTSCLRPENTTAPLCLTEEPPPAEDMDNTEPDADPDKDDGRNQDPNNSVLACPMVDGCGADEPNDGFEDAVLLDRSTLGCSGFGLERWSKIRQDEACPGDTDQYYLEYYPCEESSFEIVLTLETRDACADAGVLELLEQTQCGDPGVRCEQNEDGYQTIAVNVPPQEFPQDLETLDFTVRPRDMDLGVEYILRASIDR